MTETGIFVDKNTHVLVQGITGRLGSAQTQLMLDYGTKIVAGVAPGRSGEKVHGIPVYDSVEEVLNEHYVDASVVYVPAPFVRDAAIEAMDAGIKFMVIISDWVSIHDEMDIKSFAMAQSVQYIGPNTPGIIVPGQTVLGMISPDTTKPGRIAVVSRSGTLTEEATSLLTEHGLGQSVVLGLGGDQIVGTRLREVLSLLEEDEHTKAMVIVGEIGGTMEEEAAEFIKDEMKKPVVAFIAGVTAPSEKRMGHAGAITIRGHGTAESKIRSFQSAGVNVAKLLWDLPDLVKKALGTC